MKLFKSLAWRVSVSYSVVVAISVFSIFIVCLIVEPNALDEIIVTIGLVGVLSITLSLVLGHILVRRTVASIKDIANTAKVFSSGDFTQLGTSLVTDDTQELLITINRMAQATQTVVKDMSGERNKLSAVLNTMADGVIVINNEGRISLMNQAAQLMLDIRRTDVIGTALVDIARNHELQSLVLDSIKTKELRQLQIDLIHQRRLVSAIATPLGSKEEGLLLTLHDLTQFRQLETTRREFVSNVSHELRNPIASIKSLVETLSGGALEDLNVAYDFISRIERDIVRMEALVSELLELSILESGRAILDLQPVSIAAIATETAAGFQDTGISQNIGVSVTIGDEIPIVSCESSKIGQVFTNLIDNAIKFTPSQGQISISAEYDERYVTIRISNTGEGISPEHLPHLFERFYKVDRSRHDQGIGLGLSIVKHIVLAHGGQVYVDSELGESVTFSFTLPRAS